MFRKREQTEEKNEFSETGKDRAKKSGKFSAGRKNGRKEGERENFRKIKIFSGNTGREKRFLKKERKRQEKQDSFRKKERNGRMGRAEPDGGRMAGIF